MNPLPARNNRLISAALILAALIHAVPSGALFKPQLLTELYGLAPENTDLMLLMRHRAAMFALLALALATAVWRHHWRVLTITWTSLSDLIFLALAASNWPLSRTLQRVAWADVISVALLIAAACAMAARPTSSAETHPPKHRTSA